MRNSGWIALIVLLLGSLACSLTGGAPKSPTAVPTAYIPEATLPAVVESPTVAPATIVPTMAPTAIPTIPVTTSPIAATPVATGTTLLLVDQPSNDSTNRSFAVVDPSSGTTVKTFSVNGVSPQGQMMAAGEYVFYVDATTNMIRRAGTDGSNVEMSFTNTTEKPFMGVFLPSPDGQRIAWGNADTSTGGSLKVVLNVANVDGSNQKTLVDETRTIPTRTEPVHWSADGKALYFTNAPYGIGGYILFYGWSDLQKADLATGKITEVLPSLHCLCAGAISPDETQVAYINRPEADFLELMVMDIASGNKTKLKLPTNHLQAGGLVWSPDSRSLVVTAALGNPSDEASTVLKIEPATGMVTTIIPDDKRVLQSLAWPSPNVIWLKDVNSQAWRFGLNDSKLEQVGQGQRLLTSEPH